MTTTLGKRAMTKLSSSQPVPSQGQGVRRDAPHDAREVADSIRRLTLRASRAVKPTAPAADRYGVHGDIVQLEAALDRLGLQTLLTFTSALRRRVESVM